MRAQLDIHFNFFTDTPKGKDPDARSPTLRRYHKLLWSKALPNGQIFDLDDSISNVYLWHESSLGRFSLTSDAITHSYRDTKRLAQVLANVPAAAVSELYELGSTIGAYIIFPGNRIDGRQTINGARGCSPRVRDRFDVTLECIRRLYQNEESPLSAVLSRYSDFFSLFGDFRAYVDFFLLQDLVTPDYSGVRFHIPYQCFTAEPWPVTRDQYLEYQCSAIRFIRARAERMLDYANG